MCNTHTWTYTHTAAVIACPGYLTVCVCACACVCMAAFPLPFTKRKLGALNDLLVSCAEIFKQSEKSEVLLPLSHSQLHCSASLKN